MSFRQVYGKKCVQKDSCIKELFTLTSDEEIGQSVGVVGLNQHSQLYFCT